MPTRNTRNWHSFTMNPLKMVKDKNPLEIPLLMGYLLVQTIRLQWEKNQIGSKLLTIRIGWFDIGFVCSMLE